MSDSVTPWTSACQASLSNTNSQSLLKLMSITSVMPSNHLIFCHPLLLLPSIFPSIRVFSNDPSLPQVAKDIVILVCKQTSGRGFNGIGSFLLSVLSFGQAEESQCLNLGSRRSDPGLVRSCARHNLATVSLIYFLLQQSIGEFFLLGAWKNCYKY